MKTALLLLALLPVCLCTHAQLKNGRLEAYATPGLFSTQLSNDTLIPATRRGGTRLGDVTTYGVQYGVPLNPRLSVKAGIAYTVKHFSINKYSLDDLFTAFFLFDSPPRKDSFAIANVHYTNSYVELPLSVELGKNRGYKGVHINYGANARLQLLAHSTAVITLDETTANTQPADISLLQKAYTKDMNKVVFSIEPYMDVNIRIYKGAGVYFRFKPFSFYASPLSSRVTDGESEFIAGGIGAWYQF